MALEPIPKLEPAIAAISMVVMADSLNSNLTPEQHEKGRLALRALKTAWPDAYRKAMDRVQWVPAGEYSTRAMWLAD